MSNVCLVIAIDKFHTDNIIMIKERKEFVYGFVSAIILVLLLFLIFDKLFPTKDKPAIITGSNITAENKPDEIYILDTTILPIDKNNYLVTGNLFSSYHGDINFETSIYLPPKYPTLAVNFYIGAGIGSGLTQFNVLVSPTIGLGLEYKDHGVSVLVDFEIPSAEWNVTLLYSKKWIIR